MTDVKSPRNLLAPGVVIGILFVALAAVVIYRTHKESRATSARGAFFNVRWAIDNYISEYGYFPNKDSKSNWREKLDAMMSQRRSGNRGSGSFIAFESGPGRMRTESVALNSSDTILNGGTRTPIGSCPDRANILLLIEHRRSNTPWFSDDQLAPDTISQLVDDAFAGFDRHSPLLLFADGRVFQLRRPISSKEIVAMFSLSSSVTSGRSRLVNQQILTEVVGSGQWSACGL